MKSDAMDNTRRCVHERSLERQLETISGGNTRVIQMDHRGRSGSAVIAVGADGRAIAAPFPMRIDLEGPRAQHAGADDVHDAPATVRRDAGDSYRFVRRNHNAKHLAHVASIALMLVLFAGCSIRPKQWIGVGLTVATAPVNLGVQSQPTRIVATFALLATAIAMFELDARRDRTDERVTLVYYGADVNPPKIGHYIKETCSPNVLWCAGPYQVYAVQAVKRLDSKRPAYLVSAVIVPRAPLGSTVHKMIMHGPMEIGAVDDAESTVDDASCPLGCANETELVQEN